MVNTSVSPAPVDLNCPFSPKISPQTDTFNRTEESNFASHIDHQSLMSTMDDGNEDAMVASVLAFLDDFYSDCSLPDAAEDADDRSEASGSERAQRDANRARKEAQQELQTLRSAVLQLEHELKVRRSLKRSRQTSDEDSEPRPFGNGDSESKTAGDGDYVQAKGVWRETATSQLKQRVEAETENKRLRGLVGDSRTVLWSLRNKLLGHATTQVSCSMTVFGLRAVMIKMMLFRLSGNSKCGRGRRTCHRSI